MATTVLIYECDKGRFKYKRSRPEEDELDRQKIPLTMKTAVLAGALGLLPSAAHAVCFMGGVSVDPTKGHVEPWNVEFRQSQAVLIGTVGSERKIPDPENPGFWTGTVYTLKVDAHLKGTVGTYVKVFSEQSSGQFPLAVGSRYILFLHYDAQGKYWIADPCGNAAKLVYPF